MKRRWILLGLTLGVLSAGGCKQNGNDFVAPPPPEVTVSAPRKETVVDALYYTGTMRALDSVSIRSRVTGFIQSINFKDRQWVKKDEVLFVIDPAPYQAAVDKATAQVANDDAALKFSETELAKYVQARQRNVATELELAGAQAKRDIAVAQAQSSKAQLEEAQLDLNYTQIHAPLAGRVDTNTLSVGNLVTANEAQALCTLIDDRQLYVDFSISENDLLMVMRARGLKGETAPESVNIPMQIALADEQGYPHEGRVNYWGTQIDAGTGTIGVRGLVANSNGMLYPGMFVRVRVPLSSREAVLIPDVAVGQDQGGSYVLLVDSKDTVEKKPVKLGNKEGSLRIVEEGLTTTDRVIVNGMQRARPGAPVTVAKVADIAAEPSLPATSPATAPATAPASTTTSAPAN